MARRCRGNVGLLVIKDAAREREREGLRVWRMFLRAA